VHTVTATGRSFLSRELLKSPNFVTGTMLMFLIGGILSGTLALIPTMLQQLMHYPVMTTGLVTATRGFGTMAAMFIVGRLIGKVDVDAARGVAVEQQDRAGVPEIAPHGVRLLVQTRDRGMVSKADLKVVTKRQPTPAELDDLLFAWQRAFVAEAALEI